VDNLRGPLPPGQFYSKKWVLYSAFGEPKVDLDTWRLKFSGLVDRPYSLTYEELLGLSKTKYVRDFHCVTKWSIKDVEWEGAPLGELIRRASPRPQAEWVLFVCADGYTTPVPLEDAMSNDSIVAIKMNGNPIPKEQGFPARPFIPHLYGWKSAKWLTELRLLEEYVDGYWEMYGYHERGRVYEEERYKGDGWKKIKKGVLGTLSAERV
jgi:DMSO/TMAO reductase YedYZ molybdopterin-dependent catalytic subunit